MKKAGEDFKTNEDRATECPVVYAVRRGTNLVVKVCPFCGGEHYHGCGGWGAVLGAGNGHRGSHCVVNGRSLSNRGYILEEVETLRAMEKRLRRDAREPR